MTGRHNPANLSDEIDSTNNFLLFSHEGERSSHSLCQLFIKMPSLHDAVSVCNAPPMRPVFGRSVVVACYEIHSRTAPGRDDVGENTHISVKHLIFDGKQHSQLSHSVHS